MANFYTKNATIEVDGHPPIIGYENILEDYKKILKKEPLQYHFQTTNVTMMDNQQMLDEGILTIKNNKNELIDKSKYISFWKKINGRWKIYRDVITTLSLSNKTSKGLTTADVIGDTLHYVVGDAIFDIVMPTDSTLYWKSFNPKYGKEAHEKIVIIPINEYENMVSYVEKGNIGVCWYNDFKNEVATVSVFAGSNLMTFSGTVKKKHN